MEPLYTFKERLLWLLGDKKISDVAREWGISASVLRSYLDRGSEPSLDTLVRISNGAVVNERWLLTGEGEPRRSDYAERLNRVADAAQSKVAAGDTAPLNAQHLRAEQTFPSFGDHDIRHSFVFVPRVKVRVSAGTGADNPSAELSGALAFRRGWVERELRVRPRDLCVLEVTGNSMEPTLYSGDVVLIDTSQREVMGDGVFVLRDGDNALVKRLQRVPGGGVSVMSDNPRFPQFTLGEEAEVVGRVVWRAGRV